MRSAVLLLLTLVTPAGAQSIGVGAGPYSDPTHKVSGSGRMPAGWAMRFDPIVARAGRPAPAPPRATDVDVQAVAGGVRVRSGPAAIYWRASDVASGRFTVSATFTQTRGMAHEAYGLLVGGAHLDDGRERYLYFVVRPQDGGILVSRRTSDARPTALVPWTVHPAVHRERAGDGAATNRLAVRVDVDSVWFVANDRVVRALARADLRIPTDGVVGVRVNHNLDLLVTDLRVDRAAGRIR
ncbi:hypothetical protein J421_0561 [Gemmatirosa kalamazoonensis]|uniref:3-keto-disaccharide hydrolase domain-containing protein n=1 Tax=Gemmatirosa kalamazoonensis TaxID=861299 RepID=W0RFD6_9BACT|nr:hypothetical protein J421_0561 [Gemmatirosa kalamazoonensis]